MLSAQVILYTVLVIANIAARRSASSWR